MNFAMMIRSDVIEIKKAHRAVLELFVLFLIVSPSGLLETRQHNGLSCIRICNIQVHAKYRFELLSNLKMLNNVMCSSWKIALPWKHYTHLKLHQLVHLLPIEYVNEFCEMQQLRLRRWNFIT